MIQLSYASNGGHHPVHHSFQNSNGGGYVPPKITHTHKGDRVYFYDRHKHKKNYEFSNFFPKSVVYKGVPGKTAEHRFQAEKFNYSSHNPQIRQIFSAVLNAPTPKKALKIARLHSDKIRSDWHKKTKSGFTKKEKVMLEIVRDKFTRHPDLKAKLKHTHNVRLVEASDDIFWGRGPQGNGENKLGRILMKVRSCL